MKSGVGDRIPWEQQIQQKKRPLNIFRAVFIEYSQVSFHFITCCWGSRRRNRRRRNRKRNWRSGTGGGNYWGKDQIIFTTCCWAQNFSVAEFECNKTVNSYLFLFFTSFSGLVVSPSNDSKLVLRKFSLRPTRSILSVLTLNIDMILRSAVSALGVETCKTIKNLDKNHHVCISCDLHTVMHLWN